MTEGFVRYDLLHSWDHVGARLAMGRVTHTHTHTHTQTQRERDAETHMLCFLFYTAALLSTQDRKFESVGGGGGNLDFLRPSIIIKWRWSTCCAVFTPE